MPNNDPRVALLGQHAFVRVKSAHPVDRLAWLVNTVSAIGARTGSTVVAMACCSQLADQHIAEAVFSCTLSPMDVATEAMNVYPLASDATARASTCSVRNFEWFAECIESTGDREVVTYDPNSGVHMHSFEFARTPTWRCINAWVAGHTETAELMHPRAINWFAEAGRMERALMRLLNNA